ncbi:MAG: hypothetical protein WBA16_04555 [Nonlabens sp.]
MRYLLFMLLMCSAFAKAQSLQDLIPNIEERPREITDTLGRDYDVREVAVQPIEDLREQYTSNDFNYIKTADESDNFMSRLLGGFFDWLEDIFGIKLSPFWTEVLTYGIYIIIGGIALYFLIKLLSNEAPSRLLGRTPATTAQVKIDDTHIDQIDLDQFIKDSVASGDYRSAVRYLYLESLKILSSREAITWDFKKSNADYYREIKDAGLKAQFKKASYLYDHIWYGEFQLDEKGFDRASKTFATLNNATA